MCSTGDFNSDFVRYLLLFGHGEAVKAREEKEHWIDELIDYNKVGRPAPGFVQVY